MKKCILFLQILSLGALQAQTFTINNNQIVDPCSNVFIPRGVNYSIADDWNFPSNLNNGNERSSEIIKANPNTVRIQWYVDYGQATRPVLTLSSLDSVISRFAKAKIVSILELHDFTHIHTDTAAFNNVIIDWWKEPAVLALINKHKSHLILNIANEYGPALYPAPNYTLNPNYSSQINIWVSHIKNCILYLRGAGITVPIMIDAANYGMDYQAVIDHGNDFKTQDPLSRIIMSCHAYWGENASGMANIVNQLANLTVPVVFGEVGNLDFSCNPIEMDALLARATIKKMGWLAWTWNRDECATRNMTSNITNDANSSTDGRFSSLTSYGQTIVNNATFGLAAKADKAQFGCATGIDDNAESLYFHIYPIPAKDKLTIESSFISDENNAIIYDIHGRILQRFVVNDLKSTIDISNLLPGSYTLSLSSETRKERKGFYVY